MLLLMRATTSRARYASTTAHPSFSLPWSAPEGHVMTDRSILKSR